VYVPKSDFTFEGLQDPITSGDAPISIYGDDIDSERYSKALYPCLFDSFGVSVDALDIRLRAKTLAPSFVIWTKLSANCRTYRELQNFGQRV